MTPDSPTAQSGPSDRAIAQAFREATENGVSYAPTWLLRRAIEIDQEDPPAGARDAVTDEMVETALSIYYQNQPLAIPEVHNLMRAALEAALTGKADGAHGHAAASDELAAKEVLVPCDCGCGRQCCAMCGNDLGFIAEATQPAATGAGEDVIRRAATEYQRVAVSAGLTFTPDPDIDAIHLLCMAAALNEARR